jgi:hypothetical protein
MDNMVEIALVTSDPDALVLSPNMLIQQRTSGDPQNCVKVDIKDIYWEHWKQVQVLSDIFCKHWREKYLKTLQTSRKWWNERKNIKSGDFVLLHEKNIERGQWPMGVVETVFKSDDGLVITVDVRVAKDGKISTFKRPVTEIALLWD